MKVTQVILQCRNCLYKTHNGTAPMIIESKRWLKKRIKAKMIVCPICDSFGPFDIVWENNA